MSRLHLALCSAALLLSVPTLGYADDDDIGASREAICCGSNCCLIAGTCYSRGDANPADACQECNPSMTQTDWSADPTCLPDAGSPVDAGGPPVDAGTPDAGGGPPAPDAGSSGTDAGPSPTDAGSTTPMDGGSSSGTDAGTGGGSDGGCSVSPGGSGATPFAALVGLALAALVRRRRLS